jgi:uncharacterized membrane protein YcfT
MKLFTNLKSGASNRMNIPDVFYSLDIFCLVCVMLGGVCGVVCAICGLLQNVQPHYDFSQVMHLPHMALILLYVEAVLTPCSG